jgi:hypothetical protein
MTDIGRRSGERSAIEVFGLDGEHIGQIVRSFGSERLSVAVDNAAGNSSKGDVYVGGRENGVVDKFKPVGSGEYEFVCEITGWGSGCSESPTAIEPFGKEAIEDVVVDAEGNLYVPDNHEGVVDEFNSAGEDVVQLFAAGAEHVTVDTHGDVYVFKFGVPPPHDIELERSSFTGPVERESATPESVYEAEVDPVTGNIDVRQEQSGDVAEFNPAGQLQLSFGEEQNVHDFAVDGATDDVYTLAEHAGEGTRFDVFGLPVGLPSATPGEVSGLDAGGVTLNGAVNPNGTPVTGCSFEYATSAFFQAHGSSYEASVPCTPSAGGLGSGETPVAVSARFPALPNTYYHWRLVASNANGTAEGLVDRLLTSFRPAPVLGAGTVSGLSQFTATLNAMLDPEGLPVSYHVEYGTSTAYGSVAPIPEGLLTAADYGEHPVSQEITGLQAGTTYHYALVAQSTGGTLTGPDRTFTTPSIPAPAVSTGGVEGVTVGAATLTGSIDGQGWETGYHFEYGTSAAYGSDWPTVDVPLGALSGAQGVQSRVLNLLPGTVYHYRLVATNGGGVSYGPDETFTTAEYPGSVIQETSLFQAPLGINPEAKPTHPGKAKHRKHRRKTRARARARGRTKKKR